MFRRLFLILLCIVSLLLIPAIFSSCEAAPKGSGEWYFSIALKYAQEGDYQNAIVNYTDAIKVEPLLSKAYVNRAAAYITIGDYDSAIADCDQALSLDSKLPLAYVNRASADNALGNYDQAILDCNKAIALDYQISLGLY